MIEGEGIVLRVPVSADRSRWLELYADPDELRFGVPVGVPIPTSIEDLDSKIAEAAAAFDARRPGVLSVADAADPDRFLGNIAWRTDVPALLRIGDIGYGVHPDARGRGVASRALRVITRWLTLDDSGPGLARVQLDHSVENVASCRTALAAGYEREGVRRHFLPLRDEHAPDGVRRHDVCLHGFVPD